MNSPKEKAKYLYDKMNVIHYIKLYGKNKDSKGLPISMYHEQIKQCALIACEELITHSRNTAMVYDLSFDESENYWTKVKNEIELL